MRHTKPDVTPAQSLQNSDFVVMTQADFIRDYVMATYVTPARRANLSQITFVSGDIHKALGFVRRYPAVCGAVDARMFQTANGLKLLKRTGPDQGARVEWTFAV